MICSSVKRFLFHPPSTIFKSSFTRVVEERVQFYRGATGSLGCCCRPAQLSPCSVDHFIAERTERPRASPSGGIREPLIASTFCHSDSGFGRRPDRMAVTSTLLVSFEQSSANSSSIRYAKLLYDRSASYSNELRAFFLERGIPLRTGRLHLRRMLPALLTDVEQYLTPRILSTAASSG
jgi:hypothetical protein